MTAPTGYANAGDQGDDYARLHFVIAQVLSGMATAQLVRVIGVSGGGVGQAGFVDCQPIVQQADGAGKGVDHAPMFNVPVFRLQGGPGAILMDPVEGDVGLAVFASHDISRAKNTLQAAPPASRRRFDMSDGLYFGGFRNAAPEMYVRFTSEGVELVAPLVKTSGPFQAGNGATGTFTASGGVVVTVANGIITEIS